MGRIVPNLTARDSAASAAFYAAVFGVEVVMDHGFIVTVAGEGTQAVHLSLAREGGSGTQVPAVSIEVNDLDETLARARAAKAPIPYGPVVEPWGVRRFYVTDPDGHLINVLTHTA
ncbi:VOC family protein [Jannaschia donghaensis]|uniref:Putative enzyme related to lactoylglutathione lyase n=1 Tax=Jannaschia donghaensis TaxID=420998 RepID=A0A0M6YIG9_9RHOB|nr:VOC family protein [Jannaschia donghaensis]CTQ49750.1 putative enzyme related to lactoylglutathione lyase [Jannaschia donghaensis]